jgi:hypothetical protein
MQTIKFNTGRQYSANGQRIAAIQMPNGDIVFMDIDRGLDYAILAGAAEFTQTGIMAAYDRDNLNTIWGLNIDCDQYAQILAELQALALTVKPLEA